MTLPRQAWFASTTAAVCLVSAALGMAADNAEKTDTVSTDSDASENEDYQGLPPGEGRDEVFWLCGPCHSIRLVTQQGLSRETWEEVLVFMVEEEEMAELDPEDEKLVLDYLAKFYGPDRLAIRMAR